jgi:hypothetical protein
MKRSPKRYTGIVFEFVALLLIITVVALAAAWIGRL